MSQEKKPKKAVKKVAKSKDNQIKRAGVITVLSHYPSQDESEKETEVWKEKRIEAKTFESEPAHAGAKFGLTLNIGNYESIRVDATVTLPCYPEEMRAALEEAFRIAESTVKAEVKDIKRDRRN